MYEARPIIFFSSFSFLLSKTHTDVEKKPSRYTKTANENTKKG
jgi:hypothetical protein